MAEVFVQNSAFASTISQQDKIVQTLRGVQNQQTAFFNQLAGTWKGSGGAAFRDAIKEIAAETQMGTFVLDSITRRTAFAQNYFNDIDRKLAAGIEEALQPKPVQQKK